MKTKFSLSAFLFIFFSFLAFSQEQAYPRKTALWRKTQISVSWDNPTSENQHGRDLVRQAISETWERYSAIKFTGWKSTAEDNQADIHIFIEDDGPHTKGLGMEIKNMDKGMVLNFTFNNWCPNCRGDVDFSIKAIAVHEFGHALGFAHEQNRKDCVFPNCFNKEQGGDGDWYITPCDLRSIMNYCNPRWSNDGYLSELDIQAVQYLYGAPDNNANMFKGFQLVHSAKQIAPVSGKKISHEFKIYLADSNGNFEGVQKVVYHLHPTFRKNEMTSTDSENNFSIGLKVWGQFKITADVYLVGREKPLILERYLDFQGTGIKPFGETDD